VPQGPPNIVRAFPLALLVDCPGFGTALTVIVGMNGLPCPAFLPVHCRNAAIQLGGEPHTFVYVDRTFHMISRGDQGRGSLQARGL
jgi:hypothetical protein